MVDAKRRAETLEHLRPYIERARRFSGWDLSELRVRPLEPGPPWDYEAIARERAAGASQVLDLGTGGGEVLSRVADGLPARFAATEEWVVNAPLARDRLRPMGIDVVRASSLRLPFRGGAYDLVLSRHEELAPAEVVRVLRPGGCAVTQQVSHRRLEELRDFFPRMAVFPDHYAEYQRGFAAAGLTVRAQEHAWSVAYETLGDLVFVLLVAPWEIPGFDPEREIDALLAVEDALGGEHGIVITDRRYLIVAEKF